MCAPPDGYNHMLAIIGLGNPGEKYAHTRHNAGFDTIEILSQKLDIPVKKIKCKALLGEGMTQGQKIVLVKPQTFMNDSGLCVSEILNWYKLTPSQVLLIVDDIDLPFGAVRIRAKGGPGTHNGLRSIVQCTGSGDFPRIRIGMGAPAENYDLVDWVLGHFNTQEDRKIAFDAYMTAADAAIEFVKNGVNAAMNAFNSRKNAQPTA